MLPLRYQPFHQLGDTPNVIVDGAASAATRLTLSHWPGSATPAEVALDLSAQMAFAALDHPDWFAEIDVVSNNHFDQDGLCSVYALVDPAGATDRRDRAIDVARAGDFGRWHDRDAARLAMALAAYDDRDRSPLGPDSFDGDYPDHCALLYGTLLPQLGHLLDHPESVEELWSDEDAVLQAGLDALADGTVSIEEDAAHDLAVVTVPAEWAAETVHRFTVVAREAIHPMAVDNATDRSLVMTVAGDRVRLEQRYESWVVYQSRAIPLRQDLRDLATELNELEAGAATWRGDPPSTITPHLELAGGTTSLAVDQVRATVDHFLATAAPAWDPRAPRP